MYFVPKPKSLGIDSMGEIAISFDLSNEFFDEEGMFLATLRGHGKVWLQSMPISKLIKELSVYGGNSRKETGGFLNNFLQD